VKRLISRSTGHDTVSDLDNGMLKMRTYEIPTSSLWEDREAHCGVGGSYGDDNREHSTLCCAAHLMQVREIQWGSPVRSNPVLLLSTSGIRGLCREVRQSPERVSTSLDCIEVPFVEIFDRCIRASTKYQKPLSCCHYGRSAHVDHCVGE